MNVFVKPVATDPPTEVRKLPDLALLAADGEMVEMSSYWERRRQAGEVTIEAVASAPAKTGGKK